MCEWMAAIDAAIQGVPDKAEQRMRSASLSYRKVVIIVCILERMISRVHMYYKLLVI